MGEARSKMADDKCDHRAVGEGQGPANEITARPAALGGQSAAVGFSLTSGSGKPSTVQFSNVRQTPVAAALSPRGNGESERASPPPEHFGLAAIAHGLTTLVEHRRPWSFMPSWTSGRNAASHGLEMAFGYR